MLTGGLRLLGLRRLVRYVRLQWLRRRAVRKEQLQRQVHYKAPVLIGLAVAGLVVVCAVIWLIWQVPPLLYAYVPEAKERAGAEATTRTGFIAGLAGLAALGGLAVTARTYRLTQQGADR